MLTVYTICIMDAVMQYRLHQSAAPAGGEELYDIEHVDPFGILGLRASPVLNPRSLQRPTLQAQSISDPCIRSATPRVLSHIRTTSLDRHHFASYVASPPPSTPLPPLPEDEDGLSTRLRQIAGLQQVPLIRTSTNASVRDWEPSNYIDITPEEEKSEADAMHEYHTDSGQRIIAASEGKAAADIETHATMSTRTTAPCRRDQQTQTDRLLADYGYSMSSQPASALETACSPAKAFSSLSRRRLSWTRLRGRFRGSAGQGPEVSLSQDI